MNNNTKRIICLMLVMFFVVSANVTALKITKEIVNDKECIIPSLTESNEFFQSNGEGDIDPLVDLKITVKIDEIRAFDKIDRFSDPDFYVKLIVNDQEFISPIWHNQQVFNEGWEQIVDVDDEDEWVNITIQLWDDDYFVDKMCDIAKNDNDDTNRLDLNLKYSLKTGHWYGGDEITMPYSWQPDYSGYGRGNGCDDNSIYESDRDCEIWFDITQTDYDGDGITYWTEVNEFGTDPTVNDTGSDEDCDNVPIEWEYKWGHTLLYDYGNHTIVPGWIYDPFTFEDHENLDPDMDSLSNVEEYLTSKWGSDPFRDDVFVELDQMGAGPNGEPASILPNGSKELIIKAFNRQNIVFHLDDGCMGGSEMIPFDNTGDNTGYSECRDIYYNYFLHGNNNTWRKGIFHYGVVVNNASWAGYNFQIGGFQISREHMEKFSKSPFLGNREVCYGSCYMHELGHSLGLTWLGGHAQGSGKIINPLWWKFRPYKSIMNYGYMYGPLIWRNFVDYSDGSRGKNDFDDWSNIDFSWFDQ